MEICTVSAKRDARRSLIWNAEESGACLPTVEDMEWLDSWLEGAPSCNFEILPKDEDAGRSTDDETGSNHTRSPVNETSVEGTRDQVKRDKNLSPLLT